MRLPRSAQSAAAVALAAALCLGTSVGPALADDKSVAPSTTAMTPSPTETSTTAPITTTSPPDTSAPATPKTPETQPESSALSPPAAVEPALADLRSQLRFEKSSYRATELITAHVSVTNAGTATAEHVFVISDGNLTHSGWGPLDSGGAGVTIEPGQTVEASASGKMATPGEVVWLSLTAWIGGGKPDANQDDNSATASVPVVIEYGTLHGVVYGDRDGDGVVDPDEGLSGVTVQYSGGTPPTTGSASTAASGAFSFPQLPIGSYVLSFGYAPGWHVESVNVAVTAAEDPDVIVRAAPRADGNLTASLAFTQQTYAPGDLAGATLTLRNTGAVPLPGVRAVCELDGITGEADVAAGELDGHGPGVTIAAGATRQFGLTLRIPVQAYQVGHVHLWCTVGAPPSGNSIPRVEALARVPGGIAPKVTGVLLESRLGPIGMAPTPPLEGVKIYLRDRITGAIPARDVTGNRGRFTFYDVPAGVYRFGVVGPWTLLTTQDIVVKAGDDGSFSYSVMVKPGPYQPDPDAVPPGGEPVSAPPAPADVLAATGAGVTWLALGGLLSIAVGSVLLLNTSQRPRQQQA